VIACPTALRDEARICQTRSLQLTSRLNHHPALQRTTIDGVTYKVANCREERETAFRLLYQAYTQAGLMEANRYQMRVTPYHLLATTDVFVAIHQGEVICTLSLIGDGEHGVPMESIYPEEIQQLRDRNVQFGEVSCLADRRQYVADFLPVFVNLSGLVMQHARYNGIKQLLIVVHPRHERFYGRLLGFERIGSEKSYPSVCDKPAVACKHQFDRLDQRRYPLYDQIYGATYSAWELLPQPMLAADRDYFRPAMELSGCYIPMAA
jgi:N-acyl amino acid synthase FeeM